MPTREEMISFLKSQQPAEAAQPSREEMISFLKSQSAPKTDEPPEGSTKSYFKKMREGGDTENEALLNQLTLGHHPQIKAKIQQLLNGEGIANDANYVNRRDKIIAEQKAHEEAYPAAHAKGTALGFIAPMVLTGGLGSAPAAVAEGAPLLAGAVDAGAGAVQAVAKKSIAKTIGKGSLVGAGMGAAQNPGDTPGVVDPDQLKARGINGAIGLGIGGTIAGGAAAIPKIAEGVNNLAETKALKGAGAMLRDFRKAFSKGAVNDTGRFILNNKLVTAGDTFASTAEKARALRDETGEALGKGYDAAAKILPTLAPESAAKVEAAGFNPVRDKAAVLAEVKKELGYSFKGKTALQAVSDYLDQLAEEHGDQTLGPKITNKIKSSLDKSAINWERNPLAREPDSEAALKTLRDILKGKVSGQVQAMGEAIGNPNAAKNLAALNSRYGMASEVSSMAADRANRESANAAVGLRGTVAGGAGAAVGASVAGPVGAVIGGAIGAGGEKLARAYGNGVVASAANKAGKVLSSIPEIATSKQAIPGIYKSLAGATDLGAGSTLAKVSQKATVDAPAKGREKWATDGFKKVIEHADEDQKKTFEDAKGAMMSNPKLKDLLAQASDLKPGSKAMASVVAKLKAQLGKGA